MEKVLQKREQRLRGRMKMAMDKRMVMAEEAVNL